MKREYATPRRRQTLRRRGRTRSLIPSEFAPLLDSFDLDKSHRIELWSYALVLLMIDEGQVRKVRTYELVDNEWITLQILTGEQFDIIKPELSEQDEVRLLEGVRQIVGNARRARRRRGQSMLKPSRSGQKGAESREPTE